ncbi:MAG: acyl--CoA ligase [Sphingomonadales bacterium]|nr:acyl--CoA ligase [Sphingomonadales bacterium]
MPSELDMRLRAANAALTSSQGPFRTGKTVRDGIEMPIIETAPASLPDYYAHFCAQHGDAIFLVDGDHRLSFSESHRLATRLAKALVASHGVAKGDRVGIAMRNAAAWVISYMAIHMAGGVATLLNGWWQPGELAEGIADTATRLVIADEARCDRIAQSAAEARVLCVDLDRHPDDALAGIIGSDDLDAVALPALDGDDLATILFTSGSTGKSKGAFSCHRAVVQGTFNYLVQTSSILMLLTEDGKPPVGQPATIVNTPLFHVTAEVPVFLQSFGMGRKLVMMPKWDAEEAMRLIEAEQITYFVGVPLMSYEMLVHPNRAHYDLSSCALFAAGGAPRPPEHVRRLSEGMGGGQPVLGYGLTETNAIGCGNISTNYLAKPNSTGTPSLPLVDMAILDDSGTKLPQGAVGEVAIRSIANFEGYWQNEAATREAFSDDGYFRTGDLGYLDEDDYLFIVDRKKDIIIRGGENISGLEVEAAIYEHPAIAECSVFALPHDRFGEVPGAAVHFHEGQQIPPEALRQFLSERLAAFKLPERIFVHDGPLPRGGTEKIDKKALRERYAAEQV